MFAGRPLSADTVTAKARRGANVGMKLIQRRGRWANIKPTLNQHIVFAGDAAAMINTVCMHTRDITTMSGH